MEVVGAASLHLVGGFRRGPPGVGVVLRGLLAPTALESGEGPRQTRDHSRTYVGREGALASHS